MTLSIPRISRSTLLAVLLLAVAGCNSPSSGSNSASSGGSGGSGGSTVPPPGNTVPPPGNTVPPPGNTVPPPPGNTVPPPATTGSATLSWRAPTQNEDGSPLTNLAGYRVRYGTNAGALSSVRDVPNPGITTVTIQGLTAGTWYFTLHSYTNVGVESDPTAPVSKTI